jgi:hypothetical protein
MYRLEVVDSDYVFSGLRDSTTAARSRVWGNVEAQPRRAAQAAVWRDENRCRQASARAFSRASRASIQAASAVSSSERSRP